MSRFRLLAGLFALDVVLFVLGGVFRDADHGAKWVIGGIGWFGFLIVTLVLIVLAVAMYAQSIRARRTRMG